MKSLFRTCFLLTFILLTSSLSAQDKSLRKETALLAEEKKNMSKKNKEPVKKKQEIKKKSVKEVPKTEEIEIQDEETLKKENEKSLSDEIQNNLNVLKFDSDPVSRKRALNYLFDHFNAAEPFFYEEISFSDNSDLFLSNLLEIMINVEKTPDKNKLLTSANIQINKTNYMKALLTYLYPDYTKECTAFILALFESDSLSKKLTALNLISQLNVLELKSNLQQSLLSEKNPFTIQIILNCLNHFRFQIQELQSLIPFLSNNDFGVRLFSRRIFSRYPEMTEILIKRFDKSDDFFEQLCIIESVSYYENQNTEDFLLSLLKENDLRAKALDAFSLRKKISPETLANLFLFFEKYDEDDEIDLRNAPLKVMIFSYPNLEEKEQKKILEFFSKKLKESNEPEVIFSLLTYFYELNIMNDEFKSILLNLQKKFSDNWRISKMIFQILDLKP